MSEGLLTIYLTAIYRGLGRDIDILDSDRQAHRATIRMFLANPEMTAEQAHNAWVDRHVAEGWVLGRKFDPDLKTHPQMKPFRDLPPIEADAEEAGIEALREAVGLETPKAESASPVKKGSVTVHPRGVKPPDWTGSIVVLGARRPKPKDQS